MSKNIKLNKLFKFHAKTKYNLPNCFVNISHSKEYTQEILNAIQTKKKTTFFYLNSYSFYLANKNHEFQKAFNKANFVIADGYSIVWMLKTLYKIDITKVVFTYAFYSGLHKIFSKNKLRIYFLGTSEKTINKSIKIIKATYPTLNIAGYSNGFSEFKTKDNNILRKINNANPDVLICGIGMPQAEIWIVDNINKLTATCIFSVGGFFDYLSGEKKLAPAWMYNSGFEWTYRLMKEPKRLFKRYLVANSYLLYYVLKTKLRYAIEKN